MLGAGFGPGPAAPRSGARRFAAGDGGHGGYLSPGRVSVRDLVLIVLARAPQVTF